MCQFITERICKHPEVSVQGTDAEATYQLIRDELTLDGNPSLNLASFVHTWMPKQADQLMMENISKNLIDQDEYPMTRMATYEIEGTSSLTPLSPFQRLFTHVVCRFSPIYGMRRLRNKPLVRLLLGLRRLFNWEV